MKPYATMHRLTEHRRQDPAATFDRLADLLRDSSRDATLRFTLLFGDDSRSWSLTLRDGECRVYADASETPDIEIITRESTWWEIAEGNLSPLQAFARGRLRFRGDPDLWTALFRHVAEGNGATSICGE